MPNKHPLPQSKDAESRPQWRRPKIGIQKRSDETYINKKRLSGVAARAAKAGEKSPTKSKGGY